MQCKLIQTNHYLFDFLAEEAFNQQQEYIRRFLLETSILTDLTSSLCQAVTEHNDAERILRDLHQRDLFISAIDDRGDTYCYHALFAEFLQHQLAQQFSPQQQTDLHRRAAEAQTIPGRAIVHYLKAHCWEEAIDRIKVVGEAFVKDGLLGTVQGWLEALPKASPRFIRHVMLASRCSIPETSMAWARTGCCSTKHCKARIANRW